MTRSVDDLEADVRYGLTNLVRASELARAHDALSELVALVGTLTQERQERLDADQPIFVPGDAPKSMFARWCDERERAEAAEAALAREESQKRNLFFEREELWAALADMRRALDEIGEYNAAKVGDSVIASLIRRALAAAGPAPEETT